MDTKILSEIKAYVAGEEISLLPERAILLLQDRILLVADLHFGKVEHFRKNGIALPPHSSRDDIQKLKELVQKTEPTEVIFLGDLFHSEYNNSWEEFRNMILDFPDLKFTLIVGNHDILDHHKYDFLVLEDQLELRNFIFTHEPLDIIIEGKYNLCGHIHPGVRLRGKAKQSLRLPCFYFGKEMGIMPAFGTFTGTYVIKPQQGDQVFVIQDKLIVQVA